MKTKRMRFLSLALCLVMLLGVLPVGAMAATSSSSNYIYFDNTRVYDDGTVTIDVDDYLWSDSKLYLSDLAKEFNGGSNIYSIDVTFYSASSYATSKKLTYDSYTTYDCSSNSSLYCILDIEYKSEQVNNSWYDTYYVELYWGRTSSTSKYTVTASLDKDYTFSAKDFGVSSSTSSMRLYIDETPSTGALYDSSNNIVSENATFNLSEIDSGELVYYCSTKNNSSKKSATFTFSVLNTRTGEWVINTATMTVSFSGTSSTSTSTAKDFYLLATKGSDAYFSTSLLEDPGYYGYALGDYSASYINFIVESLPSGAGSLYNGTKLLSIGSTVALSNITTVSYYNSSDSRTDSMTFSLKNTRTGDYLVQNATLYFVFEQDTAKSFTVNLTSGKSYAFSQSEFTSNFTASSSSGSLKYVKITSLPAYGNLKLGTTTVKKNDIIDASRLGTLIYEPTSTVTTVTKDAFSYTASSTGTIYSTEAVVTLNGAYTPTDYTVTTSGSLVTVTYSTTTPSASTVTKTLSADDVTYLVSKVSSNGSTLLVNIPFSSSTTGVGRSLSIDKSLFTGTNLSAFTRIILVDTNSSNDCIYLTVPTASVATLYNAYSTGNFIMSLTPTTLAADDKSAAAPSVGITRDVDMTIGSINVDPAGAELSLPYLTTNDHYTSVIMVRTGYQSYEPVLDSTWSDTMPYLTSTTSRPYVTCSVQANKIYVTTVNSQSYSDMASTHWAYNYIRYLAARGIISGYAGTDAGKVKPDSYVTRAQFIKMLVTSLGLYNSSATTTYTDVTGSASWAASYIGSAQSAGIVKDSGTSFRPNENITREEMALYAYRAASAAGISLSQSNAAITFTDASKISTTEMATAITAMQRAGIIVGEAKNGVATGAFNPSGSTTRGAAAKIISMLMAPNVTITSPVTVTAATTTTTTDTATTTTTTTTPTTTTPTTTTTTTTTTPSTTTPSYSGSYGSNFTYPDEYKSYVNGGGTLDFDTWNEYYGDAG